MYMTGWEGCLRRTGWKRSSLAAPHAFSCTQTHRHGNCFRPQVPSKQPFVFLDFYTKMTLLGPVRQKQDKRINSTGPPCPVSLGLITTRLRCPFRWLKMRSLMVNLNNRQCQHHHLRRAPTLQLFPISRGSVFWPSKIIKAPGRATPGLPAKCQGWSRHDGSFWEPAVPVPMPSIPFGLAVY